MTKVKNNRIMVPQLSNSPLPSIIPQPPPSSPLTTSTEEVQVSITETAGADSFRCVYKDCGKSSNTKGAWRLHDQMYHGESAKYMCFLCGEFVYGDRQRLVEHLEDDHKCTRIHALKEQIDLHHLRSNHQRSFFCPFCDKVFQHGIAGVESNLYRLRHLEVHIFDDKIYTPEA